jgi:D-alanyl-D-alanine carboxypeptidase (penicillin-binding protein 5/6)
MEARAAFVLDITSGTVLYQRNADVQLPLASLTKVLLALAVSEVLAPDRVVTIPREITAAGTSQRLAADTSWRVRDVLTFTLVTSSNEGAEFLATLADDALRQKYPVAPASGATLWRMNNIAAELGLSHTYFLNVSGLDASETEAGAYGSARDVATVMAYAASTSPHVFAGTTHDGLLLTASDGRTATASNTNEALGSIQGVMMGKTGYTDLAGGNLAIVFDAGLSHPIVAVVLGSSYTGRFTDMKSLVAAVRASLSGQ